MSLFVRDWTAVSPLGVGKASFCDAVRARLAHEDGLPWGVFPDPPALFDAFDKKAYLGNKGVRGMDNLGAYATVASHLLVSGQPAFSQEDRSRVGVVLGTGTGSLKSHVEFIRDLHEQERVEWVNPIQFPQTVINCAASQVGIWHGFTGVNTTVSGGQHSGVTAFEYTDNLFQQGRTDLVLVGCAEEYSHYSPFLFPVDPRGLRERQALGEGCVLFATTASRCSDSEAELFGFRRLSRLKAYDRERLITAMAVLIDEHLAQRGSLERGLRHICFNAFSPTETEVIAALRQRAAGMDSAVAWCSNAIVADCLSATMGFQIAVLLAAHSGARDGPATDLALTFDAGGGGSVTFVEWEA